MPDRFKLIPAVYLVLRRDNQVLLLKRANTGYMDGKYSLVAGHLEGDELAREAMAREASEEAGIIINPSDLKLAHFAHRLSRGEPNQERVDIFFATDSFEDEVKNMEPHKCDELAWFDLDNLPKETIPFVRRVLEDIGKDNNYSEYINEPKS
jgi:8-oxo-dGTP diphosphatase